MCERKQEEKGVCGGERGREKNKTGKNTLSHYNKRLPGLNTTIMRQQTKKGQEEESYSSDLI